MKDVNDVQARDDLARLLNAHHQTTGMQVASGVTCACGYWTGNEPEAGKRPLPWGLDRLDLHRAEVLIEALTAAKIGAVVATADEMWAYRGDLWQAMTVERRSSFGDDYLTVVFDRAAPIEKQETA